MRGTASREGVRRRVAAGGAAVVVAAIMGAFSQPGSGTAATPAGGVIDGSAPVSWDFAPVGGPTADTDTYALTVKLPQTTAAFYAPDVPNGTANSAGLTVVVTWSGVPGTELFISATDPNGNPAGQVSAGLVTTSGRDTLALRIVNPVNGTYTLTLSDTTTQTGFSASATPAHAVATLELRSLKGAPAVMPPAGAPTYRRYQLPADMMPVQPYETAALDHRAFGEPSIGVDPKTDAVMYQAGLYTMRAMFDDRAHPAKVTWTNVSPTITNTASEDAILHVDRATGRTFVSQLTLVCSLGAVSDDDGASWTPAVKPCETPPAVDHQTIGAGPFAVPLSNPGPVYPDAVYYCSQNVAYAECALSLDGGLTYGAASPMYTSADCFGLHGHIAVGPDGTLYVPNKACGAPECLIVTSTAGPDCHRAVIVSRDNGVTWSVSPIPDSHMKYVASGDPAVAVGSKGTVYFGYDDRDGHPKVAVSHDHGLTWSPSVDVGVPYGIANTQMPVIVAGDDDRAAFAFLGSRSVGEDQDQDFVGTWHLYVATTYDGGAHWTTVDATPDKPVQRGCIEFGGSCPSRGTTCRIDPTGCDNQRNLLDFNGITIDREGRVLVAYTDGCDGQCVSDAHRLSGLLPEIQDPALVRQECGRGLYAQYDAQLAAQCPATGKAQTAAVPATGVVNTTGRGGAPTALPNTAPAAPLRAPVIELGALATLAAVALRRRRRFSRGAR